MSVGAPPGRKAIKRALARREAFLRRRASGELVKLWVPEPFAGALAELGPLVGVIYEARKGRARRAHLYEHLFDDPPVLCESADGGLVIAGGSYRVTPRGIEG